METKPKFEELDLQKIDLDALKFIYGLSEQRLKHTIETRSLWISRANTTIGLLSPAITGLIIFLANEIYNSSFVNLKIVVASTLLVGLIIAFLFVFQIYLPKPLTMPGANGPELFKLLNEDESNKVLLRNQLAVNDKSIETNREINASSSKWFRMMVNTLLIFFIATGLVLWAATVSSAVLCFGCINLGPLNSLF